MWEGKTKVGKIPKLFERIDRILCYERSYYWIVWVKSWIKFLSMINPVDSTGKSIKYSRINWNTETLWKLDRGNL